MRFGPLIASVDYKFPSELEASLAIDKAD
jgi:hypothetical protein